jgi:IMP cyclohydrolase
VKNPIGPYPGRQLFIGLTTAGLPCLAYLVTGRSPESRERKAIDIGDRVAIGPLGAVSYDPLRHYTALLCDNATGVAAITNGIQTEAVFETYRLLYNVKSPPSQAYLEQILEGAGSEPDSLHTPRIAGVITTHDGNPVTFIGIKRHDKPAQVFGVRILPGAMTGVSTYDGALENPAPFDPTPGLPGLELAAASAIDAAKYLFDISAATNKGQDIRVCAVAAVRSATGWNTAIVNAH